MAMETSRGSRVNAWHETIAQQSAKQCYRKCIVLRDHWTLSNKAHCIQNTRTHTFTDSARCDIRVYTTTILFRPEQVNAHCPEEDVPELWISHSVQQVDEGNFDQHETEKNWIELHQKSKNDHKNNDSCSSAVTICYKIDKRFGKPLSLPQNNKIKKRLHYLSHERQLMWRLLLSTATIQSVQTYKISLGGLFFKNIFGFVLAW